jgi:hypothetical protein
MLDTLSHKSDMAAAILYALKLWPRLMRYVDDIVIEIDNSSGERALRDATIGRRNHLFAGAYNGGERGATIYSLIGSAMLICRTADDGCILVGIGQLAGNASSNLELSLFGELSS